MSETFNAESPKKHKITVKKKLKKIITSPNKEKLIFKDSDLKIKENKKREDMQKKVYNEEFINILNELKEIQLGLGDHFRSAAYGKAEEELIKYKDPIYSVDQIKHLPHIGKTIIEKLNEYVKTGKLRAIEKEKNNPILLFTKIHGIGPKKAEELIKKGIITIESLENNKDLLNSKQQIGLKYFKEINQRIPRNEIEKFKDLFVKLFQEVAPEGSSFEIVGSYRRGTESSGDIDIIITNKDNKISSFNNFLNVLIKDKIIVEVLSRGPTKSMTIAKLPGDTSIARRIDFLYAPPDEYAFAILYFTGSKYFNVVMRQHAIDMGFSLNEHGLSRIINKQKVEKITNKFPDEESIFEFLNLVYKNPKERKHGLSVEIIGNKNKPEGEEKSEKPESVEKSEKSEKPEKPESVEKPEKPESVEKSEKPEKIVIKVKKTTLKKKIVSNESLLQNFLKEGVSGLNKMSEEELTQLIKKANNEYYCNSKPIMTDNQYDILREYIIEHYPSNQIAKEGHKMCSIIIEKNKIKLPYEMWSMDKIKPDTKAIEKWKKKYKGPYVISAKLDGISALYTSGKNFQEAKFYTRGNGIIGQDITHLIPYIIWKNKAIHDFEIEFSIRGEIIINKEKFEKKYANKFSNPRNFVAGVVNSKTIDINMLKDLDFVPYEVISPSLKPDEQMKFIENEWISKPVQYKLLYEISNEILSKILIDWRENYIYEIDGVICINNEIYPRPKGNPEYAFAFKMVLSDQIAEAKVIDILWSPTKDGYLSPRVQIEPVKLRGSTINFVTGKNAKFIEDNKIGIGAIIKLVKAGDVIPEIESVITPAPEALFPSEPYIWNESHIEIMLKNKENDERVLEKNIETFFKALEVDGLGPGLISRIISAGYSSVPAILAMTESDFLKIEGFKKKLAQKIYTNIHSQINNATLPELMVGSNIFGRGFGEKKFELIINELPNILNSNDESDEKKIKELNKIPGLAQKTSEKFVEKIPAFIKFLEEANLKNKLLRTKKNRTKIEEHELNEKKIVTTGFRFDKKILEKLDKFGVKIQETVTKQSDLLIIKDKDEQSGKVTAAEEKNIPIITRDEFIKKYHL